MRIKPPARLLLTAALVATFGCAPSPDVHVRVAMSPVVRSPSLEQGIALLRSGNVSMAIETLRIAARQEPDSKRALNALGVAYDRLGRFDLSHIYYEQALAIAPADADILHNLSVSLRLQGRTAEAEQVAQEEQSRRLAATEQHADVTPAPPATPLAAPSVASAEAVPPHVEKAAAVSAPPAPPAPPAPSFAVRGASIDVALPPPIRASAGITIPAQAVATRPVAPIAMSATVRRASTLGLRVVNCVGRRGMARRIAGAIAARGFGGAELADEARQFDRTVLILPHATPARFSEVLRSLNLRPAVIAYRNVKFATLMLGADAVALDERLVRTRRT
jgi:hypothetical protein